MLQRSRAGQPISDSVPESMARRQLEDILASDTFSRSDRLSRFLRFIVEETLEGRSSGLKEDVLACHLYDRGTDFNAATDPAVRVDARRLRDKLREYYAEFPDQPVVITVPRGGYVPSFGWSSRALPSVQVQIDTAVKQQELPRTRRSWWKQPASAVTAATVLALTVATVWFTKPEARIGTPGLVPLTSYPGDERWPSLSPDGTFVAFTCSGRARAESTDICVKAVGSEDMKRVVETSEDESRPAWSPDGRQIAFARSSGSKELGIFVVSLLGGADRRISETGTGVAWSPDGKSILVRDRLQEGVARFGIFHLNLDTQQRRRITEPLVGAGDWSFEISPDGESVAFIRYQRPGISDLYVVPLQGGEPRRLTDWNTILNGPAWTSDSREVIYAVNDRLWRIPAKLAQPGRGSPIPDIPLPAGHVSSSQPSAGRSAKLAFYTPQVQVTLRKIDLNSADTAGVFRSVAPFMPATRKDIPGHFSPDGSQVAFTSTRGSADYELWVADSSGDHPRQMTHIGPNSLMLAHSWSPDGTRILFEAATDGNTDLYVVANNGGSPMRLTTSPAIEALGAWSRNSQWIYYTQVSSGMAADIWRMPASGGPPERITHAGGSEPQESPDGKHIYYVDRPPHGGESARLMRIPVGGGEAKMVLEGIIPLYWCVTDRGIYFLRERENVQSIHLYRFADETVESIGGLPFRVAYFPRGPGRFAVSRDGRWALTSVADRFEGDLMLLDNFR